MSDIKPIDASQFDEPAEGKALVQSLVSRQDQGFSAPVVEDDAASELGLVDTIEFKLPSGMLIELGPPPVAIQFLISKIFRDKVTEQDIVYARALMYIRAINGRSQSRPTDMVQLQTLANALGTDGVDAVLFMYAEHFQPPKLEDLQVVKKNLRRL